MNITLRNEQGCYANEFCENWNNIIIELIDRWMENECDIALIVKAVQYLQEYPSEIDEILEIDVLGNGYMNRYTVDAGLHVCLERMSQEGVSDFFKDTDSGDIAAAILGEYDRSETSFDILHRGY